MIRGLALSLALALIPAAGFAQDTTEGKPDLPQRGSAPTPKDRGSTAESSQRGSMGSTAGGDERTATPGAGIESGQANGMAGGRTDEGPRGGTGIREGSREPQERERARKNSQARGRNQKDSFLRPADSPPQMNRDPKPMGSGAPQVPVDQQPRARGKNYGTARNRARAGSPAAGQDNPSGASTAGPAGKGHQTQPPEHDSEAGK